MKNENCKILMQKKCSAKYKHLFMIKILNKLGIEGAH